MDERLIQRLEEQLSEAHATNGSLREQLSEEREKAESVNGLRSEIAGLNLRLEQAEAKRKAAEDNAAAAQRKQREGESSLMRVEEKNEQLAAELERARAEADRLADFEARIEQARGLSDLVS